MATFNIKTWQKEFLTEENLTDTNTLKVELVNTIERQLEQISQQPEIDNNLFKYQTLLYNILKRIESPS